MLASGRRGGVNQVLIAIVPPIIFLAGLLVYNAYKWVVPSAFTVDRTTTVEALEVLDGINPLGKAGLFIPQPQSLRSGGSSRLVVSRAADDGAFILVTGQISASFLQEKIPLDRMLHLQFLRNSIRVESAGESVEAVVLILRTETNPLVVEAPSVDSPVSSSALFADQSLLPVPAGTTFPTMFVSNNGMSVACSLGEGSGTIGPVDLSSLVVSSQLEFTLDPESSAWIEMPKTLRFQHTAIGMENPEIGLLIPRDAAGSDPFEIVLLGEPVATIQRR